MSFSECTYFVYIVTNPGQTVLYIGVTNNLNARLIEHWNNKGNEDTFAGKYYCYNLIYVEKFQYINDAINRETELKKWNRKKKEDLIATKNPEWIVLNETHCDCWPPGKIFKRY